jgi:CheY-like chemotaxis protein
VNDPIRDARRRDYILVAEDNPRVREGLVEIIRSEGYSVVSCSDGQVAMNRLRSSAALPALIVLDFEMPRMDGWAFLAEREKTPRFKTIPILGISTSHAFAGGLPLPKGVDGFLQKPFEVEAILSWIERRWHTRRPHHDTTYWLDW